MQNNNATLVVLSDCFELRYTCYSPSVNLEEGGLLPKSNKGLQNRPTAQQEVGLLFTSKTWHYSRFQLTVHPNVPKFV